MITLHCFTEDGRVVSLVLDTESELYFALAGMDSDELDAARVHRGGRSESGADALEELVTVFGE